MSNVLHVINGDSTYNSFSDTGLDGDVLVWRETLSEGPLAENITGGDFWRKRAEWIKETYGETTDGYQDKVLDEIAKLSCPHQEINLWFEFDLFCQVNLLGTLMLLQRQNDLSEPAVFLICPADYPGKPVFRGMGELDAEELEYLYDNIRERLNGLDFIVAEQAWKAYVCNNVDKLIQFIDETDYWGNLTLLKPALEAHVKRLQLNEQGLNYIEQLLLDIYNSGIHEKHAIYSAFWNTELIYGMGDAQIDIYLKNLKEKGLINI
jgi:hypothetical protein